MPWLVTPQARHQGDLGGSAPETAGCFASVPVVLEVGLPIESVVDGFPRAVVVVVALVVVVVVVLLVVVVVAGTGELVDVVKLVVGEGLPGLGGCGTGLG